MTFDDFTFIVWVGFLPIWLIVELIILWRRGQGVSTRTISMIARDHAWQITSVVYFWCAMPIHWWVPVPWEATTAGGVAFWVIQALLFVWNIAMWKQTSRPVLEWPRWLRWVNWPVWYIPAGAIAAAVLFPQSGIVPWSP